MERPTMHRDGVHKMDYTELDASPRLAQYAESEERVEIEWKPGHGMLMGYGCRFENGEKARGYISRTTGWRPGYILLLNRNSMGGTLISEKEIQAIHGLGVFRREVSRMSRGARFGALGRLG